MANVIVVLDADPARRAAFVSRARERIAPVSGLEVDHREGDGWAAVWAACPTAPISVASEGARATMVWGDAIDSSGERLDALGLRRSRERDPLASWDGFHLAIDVTESDSLVASVDPLGLLPLHHWCDRGVALVGTSIDLFRAHPAFAARLDPKGLVGLMLTNGQVSGRTLWEGVQRLGVRKQLRIRGWRAEEVEHVVLPDEVDPALAGLPMEGLVEAMGQVLDSAFRRHSRAGEPHGLLLSGGLDSRQLGGFLVDRGVPVQALTFGVDHDIEMRCARKVASVLGIPHRAREIPFSSYPDAAESLARHEGLAAGFCNVLEWGMLPLLEGMPPRLALGHAFDGVVGGIHIPWAFEPATGAYAFDTIFHRFNRWAFSPEALRDVLVPEAHPLIDEVMDDVRRSWETAAGPPNLKAWHFDLATRQRFHVGSAVWPMSFRAWPMSPAFDREVLRTAAAMPASGIGGRRLQTGLLLARHPKLARVPLDRNTFDSLPLNPTMEDCLRAKAAGLARRAIARAPDGPWNRESRFYYRTYDFDSPGWSAIRRAHDSARASVPGIVRRDAVDRFLPAPTRKLSTGDAIIDSSRAKMILGLGIAGRSFGSDGFAAGSV